MSVSGLSAAKKLCELSEWNLSNLQIQKILYIAQLLFIGQNGKARPLINTDFEAWDFGPVAPVIYHKLKVFGGEKVSNIFRRVEDIDDQEAITALEETFEATRGASASQLVAFTHHEKGAWAKHYKPKTMGVVIPNEDIESEYHDRFGSKAA